MFVQELKGVGEVFGIGRKNEIDLIKKGKLFIKRNGKEILFNTELIEDIYFPNGVFFDILFLTVKNPVGSAIKYYYQKIKQLNLTPPILFLSQNGIEASKDALIILKEIFGKESENIPVFRISLFNPVDKKILGDKNYIIYSSPIRMAISKISGGIEKEKIFEIFQKENFESFFLPSKEAKNMEYSKLFLNLIGMASATYGFSIKEGFSKKEIFKEEIEVLREYKKVIKLKNGKFLNFPHYPVRFLSFLISLPFFLLFSLRNILANLIEKGRTGKPKDLDEIDYYNGAVIKLGKELGIETPINKEIIKRVKR